MSLDKDSVVPPKMSITVSPAFPAAGSKPEQPQLPGTRPLLAKNGFQPVAKSSVAAAPPLQRIGKKRYSVGVAFKGPAKRRRRAISDGQSEHVLPSNFQLGGNIFDPLNLNSLLDEDINRATNQETPRSSPLPTRGREPVEILVPRDITDPLNLKVGGVREGAGPLLSPLKHRRRPRKHGGGAKEDTPTAPQPLPAAGLTVPFLSGGGSVPVSPLPCELNTAITCRDDVAPPPVLPRRHSHPPAGQAASPRGPRRRRRTASARPAGAAVRALTAPTAAPPTKFQTPLVGGARVDRCGPAQPRKDKRRYQYGNRSRYYGYHGSYSHGGERHVGALEDPRLRLLQAHWFRDKKVLEVGCGAGHMALYVASRFNPAHIVGVELDHKLVHAAKQNVRHFLSHDLVEEERRRRRRGQLGEEEEVEAESQPGLAFPLSFRVSRGPLAAPPLCQATPPSCRFPHNVTFIQGDFVSEQEAWPGRGQYDVIMCLGVTKWVHLQAGDGGLLRLFRRAYHSLSPGGTFILQPQPWSCYGRSKRASETTYLNYRRVRLRPEQFTCYLTDRVGFTSYRLLKNTGNQRPIYVFHKSPAHRE